MVRRPMTFLGTLALGLFAGRAGAATMTVSSLPPQGAEITYADFSGTVDRARDYTDSAGPPGQVFSPGSGGPYLLNAITVKGFADTADSFGGGVNTGTWTITVSLIASPGGSPPNPRLFMFDQETLDPSVVTDGDAYYTIKFDTPIQVLSGLYAYDIYSSNGYFGFATGAGPTGLSQYGLQHGSTARTALDQAPVVVRGANRTHFIDLTPVPEPASAGLLAGALLFLASRRGHRS